MRSALFFKSTLRARHTALGPDLGANMAMLLVKLRAIAPYALMELILPGGSVMAGLLWLYRRRRKIPASVRW